VSPFDSHRGHLELAFECLQGVPFEVGAPRFVTLLKKHVEEQGVAAKYHATITWAFLALLAERMAPGLSFDALLERHPELLDSKLLKERYPGGELETPRARATFVLPQPSLDSARDERGRARD
jgi:hypothetical protein